MAGCGLRENDIGIFEQTKKITKHQVGCILYNHKIIIRHFIPSDAAIELFSTNRFYKNFFCEEKKIIVIGKLALAISNHQW